MMITESAQNGFAAIHRQSIEDTLQPVNDSHQWDIQSLPSAERIQAKEFIILTICSFTFRLFTTLHFSYDPNTVEYVADVLKIPATDVTKEKFYDCLKESSNMYCGAVKRTLSNVCSHSGMSTPDILGQQSYLFFENLKYEYEQHSVAVSQKTFSLFFGLYVCPYRELEFEASAMLKHDSSQGEVELF